MADKKDEPKIYRVLCWGACIEDYPCGLEYQGMRYETGSLIALPPSIAKRHIEKGRLELEKDKVRTHGGIPLEEAAFVDVEVVEVAPEVEAEPELDAWDFHKAEQEAEEGN